MKRSTDRIITTHVGSLPRPEVLCQAWANPATSEKELEALLRSSVADVVRSQLDAGVDVANDGEFGKPMRSASDLAAWGVYIFDRLSGFGTAPREAVAPDRVRAGQPMRIVMRPLEQHKFAEFYAEAARVMSGVVRPLEIHSVDHFHFVVPDLSVAHNFYSEFGLLQLGRRDGRRDRRGR